MLFPSPQAPRLEISRVFWAVLSFLAVCPSPPMPWHPWTLSSISSTQGLFWVPAEFLSLHHSLEASSRQQIWAVTRFTYFLSLRVTVFHDLRSSSWKTLI